MICSIFSQSVFVLIPLQDNDFDTAYTTRNLLAMVSRMRRLKVILSMLALNIPAMGFAQEHPSGFAFSIGNIPSAAIDYRHQITSNSTILSTIGYFKTKTDPLNEGLGYNGRGYYAGIGMRWYNRTTNYLFAESKFEYSRSRSEYISQSVLNVSKYKSYRINLALGGEYKVSKTLALEGRLVLSQVFYKTEYELSSSNNRRLANYSLFDIVFYF